MAAELIYRDKHMNDEGHLIEIVIWRVPRSVPPSRHSIKYRAVYVVKGERVVGFDNERGKGDHMHIGGHERPYVFRGVEELMGDFEAAMDEWRKG